MSPPALPDILLGSILLLRSYRQFQTLFALALAFRVNLEQV